MFGLLVRLGVVVSIPAVSLFRRANAGQLYNDAISLYSNELIIGLCLLMMCVGCLASVLTPDPSDTKRAEEMQQITMLKDKLEVLKSGVSTAAEAVQVNGILPIVDQLIEHVDSILNVSPAEVQKIPQPPAEMQNQSYQP